MPQQLEPAVSTELGPVKVTVYQSNRDDHYVIEVDTTEALGAEPAIRIWLNENLLHDPQRS